MKTRTLILAAMIAAALPALAADKIMIADEGKLEQWSLVPDTQLMPPYPEAYASHPEEVCLVVGYLVNADGTTSDFSLLKSWTSGSNARSRNKFWADFADMASRALAQWHYAPKGASAAAPVYTAATFVFGAPQAAAATKDNCAISDLTKRLVELRYDSRANRQMAGGIFSRLAIDPSLERRYRMESAQRREGRSAELDAKAEAALMQSKK